jgi:rhodanese-related sulfurtransferase
MHHNLLKSVLDSGFPRLWNFRRGSSALLCRKVVHFGQDFLCARKSCTSTIYSPFTIHHSLWLRRGSSAPFMFQRIWLPSLLIACSLSANTITVADLQTQLAKADKLTVIDIRSPALFAQNHIPDAINVPASLCPYKQLPPLGKVVVCGEGLGRDSTTATAAAALAAKPGISVDILDGGFAAWASAHGAGTQEQGFKPEAFNYLSYAELKAASVKEVMLVDLRRPATPTAQGLSVQALAVTNQPLTDLAQEFPGMRQTQLGGTSAKFSAAPGSSTPPLLVLIDNGDGTAEALARRLKASGNHRYAILAGGEAILSRHGQSGLQRVGSRTTLPASSPASPGSTP